jgi:hypothetical protein
MTTTTIHEGPELANLPPLHPQQPHSGTSPHTTNSTLSSEERAAHRQIRKIIKDLGKAHNSWESDRNLAAAIITTNPLLFPYMKVYHDDIEMARIAVRANGVNRLYLSDALRSSVRLQRLAAENLPIKYDPHTPATTGFPSKPTITFALHTDSQIARRLYKKIAHSGNATPNRISIHPSCSKYLRDPQVTRLRNGHLMPYSIQDPNLSRQLMALLPPSEEHFFLENSRRTVVFEPLYGKGFESKNVDQAKITLLRNQIPFDQATTCIEGGNCFLLEVDDVPKAVVGIHSLYLSAIALEEQDKFEEVPLDSSTPPTMQAHRIVRNLKLYHSRDEEDWNPTKELEYRKQLFTPPTQEDLNSNTAVASQVQAKLNATKSQMAKELNVDITNLAIIDQMTYHIDLLISVRKDGTVILHDFETAVAWLKSLDTDTLNRDEYDLLENLIDHAEWELILYGHLLRQQTEILDQCGIPWISFPCVFEAPIFGISLNYANGIYIRHTNTDINTDPFTYSYITTGPTFKVEEFVHRAFKHLFKETFPDTRFQGVRGMSRFIIENRGGLRCLTLETSHP